MTNLNRRQRRSILLVLCVSSVLFFYQNCSSEHGSGVQSSASMGPSLAQLQSSAKSVLQAKCASCHNPTTPTATGPVDILDLDQLMLDGYVVIGKPQNSPVYLLAVDGVMPKGGEKLSSAELETLNSWIFAAGLPGGSSEIVGTEPVGGGGTFTPPTFSQIQTEIINPRCLNCHGSASGRRLDTYSEVLKYVVAGQPGQSSLYIRVLNNSMPQNQAPLSGVQKDMISSWIAAGARQ